jgi:hypothetical protein
MIVAQQRVQRDAKMDMNSYLTISLIVDGATLTLLDWAYSPLAVQKYQFQALVLHLHLRRHQRMDLEVVDYSTR